MPREDPRDVRASSTNRRRLRPPAPETSSYGHAPAGRAPPSSRYRSVLACPAFQVSLARRLRSQHEDGSYAIACPQRYFFFGTRLPSLRASERAIAIACLRLFTLPALPPGPLLAVPRLKRRISLSTSCPTPGE